VIAASLTGIVVLAWLYLWREAAGMNAAVAGMDRAMAMPPRGAIDAALLLAMWWVMMAGMMLPSAAPMILTFATVNRQRKARGQAFVPTTLFVAGYLLAWAGFSVAVTLLHCGLERAGLVSPMDMAANAHWLGGALFLAAGLYQFTPLKQACLRLCWSPLEFLLVRWREGAAGALAMGLSHGLYCLGCCWVLMLLLFTGGVMNLAWVAALAAIVLLEKLVSHPWVSRLGGVVLAAYGGWLLAT
jgi:predicted metal-binding membrane protein